MRIDDHNHAEKKPARGLQLTSRTPPMEELSEEMIMEIFLRLPARTLCCMKSVCSSWRTLISSPDFTWNHVRRSSLRDPRLTPPRIAYDKFGGIGVLSVQALLDNDPSEPTKVAHFKAERSYRIVGSCHGMLCLLHDDNDICGHMHALLWNPCTGFTFQSPQIRGYANFCGFGYDHPSDNYKFCGIIRILGPSGFENSARIYTFGPNSPWKIIDDIPTDDEDLSMADNKKGVYFGSSRECTLNWSFFHVVYYFDLGKETYGHFALPDRDLDHYDPWRMVCTTLCVLRNCLCVCYGSQGGHCLWQQMKEYGDAQSWTKLAMIPFYSHRPLNPLYISESDDVVLLIIYPGFKVVLYNLNDGSFPVIDQFPHVIEKFNYGNHYIYHESLALPNGLQSNSSKMLLRLVKPKP